MPPEWNFWASGFVPSVCLWLCGKKNFNLGHIFLTVRDSTNKTLSNDTKVSDLNCDLYTEIASFGLVATGSICVSQTHPFFSHSCPKMCKIEIKCTADASFLACWVLTLCHVIGTVAYSNDAEQCNSYPHSRRYKGIPSQRQWFAVLKSQEWEKILPTNKVCNWPERKSLSLHHSIHVFTNTCTIDQYSHCC